MSLSILRAGLLTTIQDLGRVGYQREGIVVGGAMDAVALRLANALVGNPDSAAGLEITLLGPEIRFDADHIIAVTGADLSPTIRGERVRSYRPFLVRQGTVLKFGAARAGCRAYLAVAGSFTLPRIMGSHATYVRAQLGGLHGAALQAGDGIPCLGPPPGKLLTELTARLLNKSWVEASWSIAPPPVAGNPVIRVTQGPEYELFPAASQAALWSSAFTVSAASDRMGYRLLGPPLPLVQAQELLSSAVTFGTVQVPPDGNPIVLMADRQTTGGYPRIAQVISADFSRLAQVALGKSITFQEVSLPEAHALYLGQQHTLQQLLHTLRLKTCS
ncbi:5-oxoprolinase subunit C family protein [Hymenobacter elongatus]|uniref:Biotin-dependent carboxyltransferase family protein n=1 Tax=Hymenobacter elongatus TaxID=877208 RepID=A0A4Z0PSJ9_9BACT|nr:biotin-dependent carboxyltransferase family protein [Hymenobacter elongatus]TGE18983.1 biotin-dependent carboxyltransferase family protein [Hymenobacter elongatus]